jgi:L-asparagine oxygenase
MEATHDAAQDATLREKQSKEHSQEQNRKRSQEQSGKQRAARQAAQPEREGAGGGARFEDWGYAPLPRDAVVVLGRGELAALRRESERIAAAYKASPLNEPSLLTDIEVAACRLPGSLLSRLIEFRTTGNPHGTLLVKGLPVDAPLPPTPVCAQEEPPWHAVAESTVTQLSIMSALGETISYTDEKAGRLVQDVHPVPGAEARQENTGSRLLELHTEDGFHPFKPAFLSLYCLRGDQERVAATVTASARGVVDRLPGYAVEELRRPAYGIRFSSSFVGEGAERYAPAAPVLSGPRDDPDLCVDFHATEAADVRGARALELLHEAMRGALVGTVLEPGDMILVDNRVAVHGRTGFTPRYDGRDRWLRRCFAVSDLRPSRGIRARGSRVCERVV